MQSLFRPRARLVSTIAVLTLWIVTTGLGLRWGVSYQHDTLYYWKELQLMPAMGIGKTLSEYPIPILGILVPLWLAAQGSYFVFLSLFEGVIVTLDAVMTLMLLRRGPTSGNGPALFWTIYVALLGSVVYYRFDMIPAFLVGTSLILATRWSGWSGVFMAMGASIKLWPALLVPSLLGSPPHRKRVLVAFLIAGIGLVCLSWLAGGWERLVSPLQFQTERGLQLESVWATPALIARAAGGAYRVGSETTGPGVHVLLMMSTLSLAVGLIVVAALSWRAIRRPDGFSPQSAALFGTTIIAILITTDKVLSPQYLLWLAAPMALILRPGAHNGQKMLNTATRRLLIVLGLALAASTQLEFLMYHDLTTVGAASTRLALATTVLTVRNLLLVGFTVWVTVLTWRQLSPATDHPPTGERPEADRIRVSQRHHRPRRPRRTGGLRLTRKGK